MSLNEYKSKRDFAKTPEPEGKPHKKAGFLFIIQKHAASHLHYDLRLELDGVLKSWAVPKGPSYNPQEKHLAVEVEDHPLEYGHFEGNIPADEYGGGTVMLWDKGSWEPIKEPHESYKKGLLKFKLNGSKMKGLWSLVRLRQDSGKKPNWLLVKIDDEYARCISDQDLLETNSVKTGRNMDEIKYES